MPLLSIVIPTRNRSQYLLDSIKVAVENLNDFEIIVCDNSDTNCLELMLDDYIKAGTVKYFYSSQKLSVVDNFERAYLKVNGEYIISIGDDDSIGPGIEQVAIWAKMNKIDAVISYGNSFIASYYWPGVHSRYFGSGYDSRLFVYNFSGKSRSIDPIKALRNAAQSLGGGLGEMPRAYHGLVSHNLIDKIRSTHGRVFGGVSPDIYSAVLIAATCNKAAAVDFPFVIPGASPASTAGQGVSRTDRGDIQATEHTARFESRLVWDKRIPEFYSPYTVWAYSLCKALERLPHLNVSPSFSRLYAVCCLRTRHHNLDVLRAMWALAKTEGHIKVWLAFSKSFVSEAFNLLWRILVRLSNPRAGGRALEFGSQKNIHQAFEALNKYIKKNGKELNLKP